MNYSLILTVHPCALFPHVRYLKPEPFEVIVERSTPIFEARRKAISRATQPISLILDADTVIPSEFLPRAIQKVEEGYTACTLYYAPDTQGHPPFGASLWNTEKLKQLYDYHVYVNDYKPVYERTMDDKGNDYYTIKNPHLCECLYMYRRLAENELYVFEDLTAEHARLRTYKQKQKINALEA